MTAGGKRTGAGRKPLPLDQRAVGITMRVRPAVAARFRAWCKGRGVSQSDAFSTWVFRLPNTKVSHDDSGNAPTKLL